MKYILDCWAVVYVNSIPFFNCEVLLKRRLSCWWSFFVSDFIASVSTTVKVCVFLRRHILIFGSLLIFEWQNVTKGLTEVGKCRSKGLPFSLTYLRNVTDRRDHFLTRRIIKTSSPIWCPQNSLLMWLSSCLNY